MPLSARNLRTNLRYALLNNNGTFLGFALVSNYGNTRYLELIAARRGQGYGKLLMNRIIKNAKNNSKKNIQLLAVSPKLVKWYETFNFVAGPYNGRGQAAMKRVLRG